MTVNLHNFDSGSVKIDTISKYLQNNEIQLKVIVGKGGFAETVWGCDLTKEYIEILFLLPLQNGPSLDLLRGLLF